MNIFVLDDDPKQAAIWHCDQHVKSAIKEFHQMYACMFDEVELLNAPKTKDSSIRKHSYYNHPCTKWIRESYDNYLWSWYYIKEIQNQFFLRFNSLPNAFFLNWVNGNINLVKFKSIGLTPFATVFTKGSVANWLKERGETDVVKLYRQYYISDKEFATWIINKPDWMP